MRKLVPLFLCLLFLLAACNAEPQPQTILMNGTSYTVAPGSSTISDGTHLYTYDFSGDKSDYQLTIYYPDGTEYWFQQSGWSGYGGWSGDAIDPQYASPDTLHNVLLETMKDPINPAQILGGILCILLGIVNILFPKVMWYLRDGWRYRNAEPSDAALAVARLAGTAFIILGIITMFMK